MGSVGQFRSSGATCTSGRRSNGQQTKKKSPSSFFPTSKFERDKPERQQEFNVKKRGYRTMTKHKRYGGQQTRGLYPHPEFTSPAL